MKRAIFLCGNENNVKRVYGLAAKEKIRKYYQLSDTVYSAEDIGKADFSGVEAVFSTWGMPVVTEEQIKESFPSLKAVYYAAGTVQAFARPFIRCGVAVHSAWIANAVPVVEYAVSQILLANKGFYRMLPLTRQSYRAAATDFKNYVGNFGAKVGILGDGAIGSRVIDELLRYKLEIYVFSITMTKEQAEAKGVRLATMSEIFSECDVISNHLANNEQTKGIINAGLIAKMKSYSTFINTGRGAQVDESALIDKLKSDPTVTAVLDVTYPEPPVEGSPFYTLPNAFLTPHVAGSAGEEVKRMAEYMADECERAERGEPTLYGVTEKMLETMA